MTQRGGASGWNFISLAWQRCIVLEDSNDKIRRCFHDCGSKLIPDTKITSTQVPRVYSRSPENSTRIVSFAHRIPRKSENPQHHRHCIACPFFPPRRALFLSWFSRSSFYFWYSAMRENRMHGDKSGRMRFCMRTHVYSFLWSCFSFFPLILRFEPMAKLLNWSKDI